MMRLRLGVTFVIFCLIVTQTNAAHEPPSGVPSFVRSSVERIPGPPNNVSDKLKFSMKPTFGSMFLPLRSAVESAPITPISSGKSFIRDSVEYRPAEAESKPTHDEFRAEPPQPVKTTTQLSGKYSAFYVPTSYDTKNPQPFRFGSPYQQIVDISSSNQISKEILKKYKQESQFDHSSKLRAKSDVRDGATNDYKILCYITNWSFYRVPEGKFVPENIDTKLCTHIVYSFASLEPESLMIREFDPWADIENNLYKRATSLDIPVLLAIGGWTDSSGNKYSRLISDDTNRKIFAVNTANFLRRHGFSGLHFDWNYPKCWQSDCRKGPATDKPNFTKLMRELRQEFKKYDLLLGVAISGYKEVITEAYEMSRLSDYADFLTVMTYDYHGGWEAETGHVSPLYGRPGDKYPQYNTDYTMQLLVKEGAVREKLIMGVPFYGQSFMLKDFHTNLVGEGTPSRGPGNAGEITRQPGMLAYYEVCQMIRKQKWQSGRDGSGKSGPYATSRNQWVGYEDPLSVAIKAQYVVNSGLGGIAAWTLDLDDFSNKCCNEAFPLLKSVNRVFGRLNTAKPFGEDCTPPPQPVTPIPVEMTTYVEGGSIHEQHTTWPSWNPGSTTTSQPTALPTTQPSTQSTQNWWQSSSEQPSTWWPTTVSTSNWWSTVSTVSTELPTTTTTEIVPNIPAPVNVMPIIVNGEHCEVGEYRPHPNNCNAYYRCVYGQLRELNCAGGLHWNRREMLCDWPAAAMCMPMSDELMEEPNEIDPSTSAPTTTTRATTTRRTTTPRTTRSTTPRTTRSTTSRTTRATTSRTTRSTTQRTTRSTTPRTTRSTTPRTTRSTTVRTTRSTTPRTTRSTTPRTTRSTTPRTTTPGRTTVSTMSDSETCMSGEYYPHSDCGSFYICVNGMLIPQECGPDLQWNQNELTCDHKSNVRCVSTERYLRLVKKSKASLDDPCEGDTHVPYPGNCNQFLLCLHGHLYGGQCGEGLHWSTQFKVCDWPANAHCTEEEDGNDYLSEEVGEDADGEDVSQNEIVPTKWPTTTTTTIRPTAKPTPRPPIEPHSGHYKLVCYFTNWAWYRKGVGKYTPDDIDTDLCTHIVYGFAVLDYSELTIRTHDSWADIDNRFYERVARLKEKGVTVSLALGGWNDSQGDKYSRLVRSPAARKKFVKQALNFVEKYGFGGLDLDWEYPVCWQTECKKGFPDEKEGFTELVKELSVEFRPKGLVLSTAVSPSKQIIDAGYDVPTLSEYFDWIAVMTYDFHGQWDKKTGHVAPLYYHPDDDISYFNANFSLHYWMEKGAPPRKLVMGMPLYGQSFTLADTKNHGLNARAPGPGQAGEATRAAGFLAYYEICDRVRNRGWQVVQDPEGRMGPYAYKDNQWVSYDDKNTLRRKSQLIRSLGLGGGMVWALDLDDFRNRCDEGYHPLLSEIQRVLRDPPRDIEPDPALSGEAVDSSVEKLSENPVDTSVTPQAGDSNELENPDEQETPDEATPEEVIPDNEVLPEEETPSEGETDPESESTPEEEIIEENQENPDEMSHEPIVEDSHPSVVDTNDIEPTTQLSNNYKVVCYFTNWAWYRQSGGKYLPEDIDTDLCTHIVYGFAVLDRDNLIIKPHDSWADLDNKFYERVTKLRAKGVKVTVAIGGWNDSAGDKYSRLVRDPAARARFITKVVEFIETHGFDGLDLDWEYPVCWQVDCSKGYPDEKEHFATFAQELREEFTPRGWLLSTAVSPSKKVIDAGYDIPIMSDTFDWIAVMAYDYHGQWDKQTGHVAPMYQHPDDVEPTFNANFSINYWIANGADPQKLVMGMPMYGQSFSLAENKVHNLNSPTYGGGEAGDATRARGFLSYYEICERIKYKGWQVVRDRKGRMGPYAYLRDQWVSFDDAYMIRHKSEFVKAMHLGGAMIWALDLDDFRNVCECEEYPLLRTINRVLRDYPGPHPRCKLETSESEIATENPNSVAMTLADVPLTSTRLPASSMRPDVTRPQKPPKPTRPTIQQDTEIETMSCNNRQFSEHSSDCNKYYQCQFGVMMEHNCPPGLHWNVDHCDWPQNANCHLTGDNSGSRPVIRPTTTNRPTTTTHTSIISQPAIDTIPVIHDDPNGFKVVCYFTNWAWYRPGEGKYTPDDIDESLCTHIVYGFAVLDRETSTIRTHDSWADIDNRFYERVVALRAKGIHVTLALGGWNDSLGDKYSNLVRSASNRARFVKQAVEFIEKYRFEGLDLDWEYPVCWQVDCTKGFADEKEGFASLVRELSEQFKPRGWLLSAAVSPSKMVIDAGYDVPTLARYFDWIAVMTYDFHGNWDKQTGHVAPLYYYPGDTYDYFNANFSINYWIEKGAPSRKLVMGVPLYGQSFSLADANKRGLNDKSYGPGEAGEFTRAGGFLSYYEICQRINAGGWNVVRDAAGRIGPYASKGAQWVSYDDVSEVRRKTNFMKEMNLGGGMVWALDLDDFRGVCGCGKHPLLRTLSQDLRNLPGQRASDCT